MLTENHIRRTFNETLVAALTNCDTVLKEVRECVQLKDERRRKSLSKHIQSLGIAHRQKQPPVFQKQDGDLKRCQKGSR